MMVMGIDPDLTSTGWCVMGAGEAYICGTITTKSDDFERLIDRVRYIANELLKIIYQYEPDLVVIEGFSFGNSERAISMGMLGGLIRNYLVLTEDTSKWREVAPTQLKKYVTGKGNANKDDMKLAVYKKWGVDFTGKANDLADAYGLAMIGVEDWQPTITKKKTKRRQK
jgi:crossover junction endodeoxyribonuclease RuvC